MTLEDWYFSGRPAMTLEVYCCLQKSANNSRSLLVLLWKSANYHGRQLLPLEVCLSPWKSATASGNPPVTVEVYCSLWILPMTLEVCCCPWKLTSDPGSLLLPLEVRQ